MALDDSTPRGVQRVLIRLDSLTDQQDVTLRDMVEAFGETSFVPLLMVPALIVVSPLSGVPLLPTVLGLTIALIAVQAMVGKRQLWLPGVLMQRQISGDHLHKGILRLQSLAGWLDRHSSNRMGLLVHPPLDMLPKALSAVCGAAMPLLELVPFSSSVLGIAIVLFAVSLLVADGLYVLLGIIAMAIGLAIPIGVCSGVAALNS